jgi:hypothetical protein
MFNKFLISKKDTFIFLIGLLIFTGLNIFSATTLELHFDEAYYWVYSQFPSFGYFDHPPMISWLILAGRFLFKNEIGVRIMIILLSTLSMIILWRMAKRYSTNALLFWALIYSIGLIHPYAFIATPDAPLLFFSILFFYFYSRYLEKNNFQNAVILAFIIALMIYSKYHAFLLLGFVILSNLKVLKRFSFWIILLLSIIYLLPHIFWQIDNHFPTFRFQLIEGHKSVYNPAVTLKYILSELAITGPLLGWLFLYALATIKCENSWEKALKFSGIGIFVFFLISTLKGSFEAHWTLVATIPLILLSFKFIIQKPKWKKWVYIAGMTNFVLLLTLRILAITPLANNIILYKTLSGNRMEAKIIKKEIGNYPVIFQDSWTNASLFAFYTQDKNVENLNSALYRKNQYDLLDQNDLFSGETIVVITSDSLQFESCSKIVTNKSVWFYKKFDDFRSYYNVTFELKELKQADKFLNASVIIHNPADDTIRLGKNVNIKTSFRLYTHEPKKWIMMEELTVNNIKILPQAYYNLELKFNISKEMITKNEIYLTLQIGEMKPIPSSYLVNLKNGSFKKR